MKTIGTFAAILALSIGGLMAQNPQSNKPKQPSNSQAKALKASSLQKASEPSPQVKAPGKAPFQPIPANKVKAVQQSTSGKDQ